ncbi:MAG: flagellar basal body L-ring protein FlgH [Bryobacteraceae bacterium]
MRSIFVLIAAATSLLGDKRDKEPAPTALERYVLDAHARAAAVSAGPTGSLWNPAGPLTFLARDLRASQVDDLVTILVTERATAISRGNVSTSRRSEANYSVGAILGVPSAAGALRNLAGVTGSQQLEGQGETSRESVLTTTLSARVVNVLPNGYLVVEGVKDTQVNAERQQVTVRGVVRPLDLSPDNVVRSDRVAQLEIRINGKGVVGDAIKRPFILYRILLGLLPF